MPKHLQFAPGFEQDVAHLWIGMEAHAHEIVSSYAPHTKPEDMNPEHRAQFMAYREIGESIRKILVKYGQK